jgi:adenylate kinase family enzyme
MHARVVFRVSVVGSAGSGKTTLARALAAKLNVVHVELDAIVHQANWQDLPDDEFRVRVESATATGGWVTCGNYSRVVQPVIWPRVDTVVWLDFPRATIVRRVTWRTLRRVITREALWNGNREPVRALLPWLKEESMIWWAWTNFDRRRQAYGDAMRDQQWAHIAFIRLSSPRQARRWLAEIGPPVGRGSRDCRGASESA